MKLALNGRPVQVGTTLTFINDQKCLQHSVDYFTVERLSTARGIDLVGNTGAEYNVLTRNLGNTFKHYDKPKLLEPNEYAIMKIADFLQVPDDKLDQCLDELKLAIRTVRLGVAARIADYEEKAQCKFTPEDEKVFAHNAFESIVWQDNGQNKTELNIGDESITAEVVDPFDVTRGANM